MINFNPVKVSVLILYLSAESKSIHHRHVVEHFFVFIYQVLRVELRPKSLDQVLGKRVVNVALVLLVSLQLWLLVHLAED